MFEAYKECKETIGKIPIELVYEISFAMLYS